MAGEVPPTPQATTRDWLYTSEVADEFQILVQLEDSEATFKWYCRYLDPFKKAFLKQRGENSPWMRCGPVSTGGRW